MSDPIADANAHLARFLELANARLVVWTPWETPKPEASRAFNGFSAVGYAALVIQANTVEFGIMHEGMLTHSGGIVHMPPDLAQTLYRQAANARN